MTKYQFPENFWWGSAASGPQTEGRVANDGKGDNIFDYWYAQEPEKFFDEVGPGKTSQVYTKYKEDVQLMKQTGHNSFRTSIQWSRLLPDESGEVNQKAVDFYNSYFDELIENGIEPFVNLYHFDMPMYLQEKGGWLNRETVEAYERYATICFELFGQKIKKWFTHNEPIVPVEAGYLYRWHYPEEANMKHAVQVGYHEALSSALAIKAYHSLDLSGKIGIILNLTPSYPRDENNLEDVKAAKLADAFFNRSFLDPAVKGEFPKELIEVLKGLDLLPEIKAGDKEIIKENTVDILGINYYQPRRIKAKETPIDKALSPMPEDFFDNYEMPGRKMNPYRGWEIYEKGIYDILINVRDNYGNIDCFISENGMGVEDEARFIQEDGMIHDDYRIEFVTDHLKYVHQAIQEGANCLGYHMWTCMDNWSWTNAYKNRYGFISVNLAKDGERTIKKSGHWFKQVSDQNGFDA
ncbi:glycoside hydrolase family 1 protein [Enterococcus thailandicus]|uniref:glycoside hydrolase family 1 protein n=1 Tax=Enterococcus thailandicus TaxID=417368 RepID=UPI0022EBD215|nr:glycoside hydrolase family 1 protein [Enterococcus thailandicus]MDA3972877.1 glycoside hydrolase family 1 protein [Enterococcus thailandicus]MDA3975689.1 glycoside hydrolase family 1 protein [Enterococcus thailandicus]MDA3980337.1 glycoside hydrolase family 1 protein [Enterococcus thailandicus]